MSVDQLLTDFRDNKWESQPFERLYQLALDDPTQLESLVERALVAMPKGGTLIDAALAFVPPKAYPRLIEDALKTLGEKGRNDVADSIVARSSLQFPSLLHRHLAQLFIVRPNRGTYYENWPWRESADTHFAALSEIVENPRALVDDRRKAWLCLLETRTPTALAFAESSCPSAVIEYSPSLYMREVGYASPGQRLFEPTVSHIVFETDYFEDERPVWISRSFHPTWTFPTVGPKYRFGGLASGRCGLCHGDLHHIVTMAPPPPANPSVIAIRPLTLATCLSCLGYHKQVLYYQHGSDGLPLPLDQGNVKPDVCHGPLKEGVVHLFPTPQRWQWQDWALSNSRENLNRVGGHPSWIQSAEYPYCPSCKDPMHFFAQLDSDLPSADGDAWSWGTGGICYLFWCHACKISAFLWQCT